MTKKDLEFVFGGQPVNVSIAKDSIDIASVTETINVSSRDGQLCFSIREENLAFSSPVALAGPGWPFGNNPSKVENITRDIPAVVDQVAMPSRYRAVKWFFFISDDSNGLAISSEINCMRHDGSVRFVESHIIGDSGLIQYDLDVAIQDDQVNLIVTSRYDGVLTVRVSKLGIFN